MGEFVIIVLEKEVYMIKKYAAFVERFALMEAWWSTKKPSDKKWFVQALIIDRLKKKSK